MSKKIIGESGPIKALLKMIERVGPSRTNILVIGDSGTGKELVARLIHDSSPLKDRPFVPVNCGAIPETLIESELFGHKKGSFTGAVADKPGLFEAANGGTLFLDEVGELPLSMQVKLLRALQDKTIRRVGGNESTKVDCRIIAATNRDLEAGVAKGTFREDLFYRLNVIMIRTPPLKERPGDIPILAKFFLERFNAKQKKELKGFTADAMAVLRAHTWPGNVRELENVVERAITLENNDEVGLEGFPSTLQDVAKAMRAKGQLGEAQGPPAIPELPPAEFGGGPIDLDKVLSEVERAYLLSALHHTGGNKTRAAELLGMTFRSIRYRLEKLGLDPGPETE